MEVHIFLHCDLYNEGNSYWLYYKCRCACTSATACFNGSISCGGEIAIPALATTANAGKKDKKRVWASLTVAKAVAWGERHSLSIFKSLAFCVTTTLGRRLNSYWQHFLSISEIKWMTSTCTVWSVLHMSLLVLWEGLRGFSRKLPIELQYDERLLWNFCPIITCPSFKVASVSFAAQN